MEEYQLAKTLAVGGGEPGTPEAEYKCLLPSHATLHLAGPCLSLVAGQVDGNGVGYAEIENPYGHIDGDHGVVILK